MLVDFDLSKTSWTKFRHMVNKPFWHISDFVLASYTFCRVKMSNFVSNNCHLREVLIFFFHSKKTAAEAHRELQKVYEDAALSETACHDWFRRFKDGDCDVDDTLRNGIEWNWRVWVEHCAKSGHNTSRGTKKWFYSMTTLGLTLSNPLNLIVKCGQVIYTQKKVFPFISESSSSWICPIFFFFNLRSLLSFRKYKMYVFIWNLRFLDWVNMKWDNVVRV